MEPGRDWSTEINALIDQVTKYYVFPDVGKQVSDVLRQRLADGAYRGLPDERALGDAVTVDMQSVNGDQHLFLVDRDNEIPERPDPIVPDAGRDPRLAELDGHGIARVERLPGNVGLLDIRRLYETAGSGAAVVAAMHVLAGTDVLILDLRRNVGGEPEMVALLCSFLFDVQTPLSALYFPADERTLQFWTSPYVPGPVFGGTKPVYVLTSGVTFSGAEGVSYDLQQHKRATVIGEPTGGAANFHYARRVSAHLISAVPSGYPVHPVSGGNWEGTGVQPDIPVAAEQALDTAYRLALQHVVELGAEGVRRAVAAEAEQALIEMEA